MNDQVFGKTYAAQYDLLYGDKNYQTECDLLEKVFRRYSTDPVKRILDLGCGTGNHAIPLAQRGYHVTGVDRAAEMLAQARSKAAALSWEQDCLAPAFVQGDVRQVDAGQQFDAALMMFAVLGYQLTNEDIAAALRTVRRHLRPGALFVCDLWYGPAVLTIRPSERVKISAVGEGQLIRAASGLLDSYHQWVDVHYHVWRLGKQQVLSESEETHRVRYFFAQELELLMAQAGLELCDIRAFDDLAMLPSEKTWNVIVVARARK
jgi:ubiquinone/menaquinone biosynthesis C-methylase UbiE